MKVLIVGEGGREHALAWKIRRSPRVTQLYCAPGNGGTASLGASIPLRADDIEGLRDFALREGIDLTVVGPELPLTLGLVDAFEACGLKAFGPRRAAAEIEGSKAFAKEVMRQARIPTADSVVVETLAEARAYLDRLGAPIVVKADGLAAGKGVAVCGSREEAEAAVQSMMGERIFGEAGARLVLEEYLEGEEASFLCLTDGKTVLPWESSQDHKRLYDGDQGPNTGGMGAYSPAPILNREMLHRVTEEIALPAVQTLAALGRPYRGVLYVGLMITPQGPKVLEFNARLGDPETQPLLVRMASDLVPLLDAAIESRLSGAEIHWREEAAVCVVLASKGYPGPYEKGREIRGVEELASWPDLEVFHAGTRREGGRLLTQGGRVLGITALGERLEGAICRAYAAVEKVGWEGVHYRTDIGQKALRQA
ncbi:MAG: phosphoribosylamine--glycine ligase [Candidatus Tectomicrobia bacterium]|uniref:Phosphoribosylamine--glycine ligase n=1 Tax=Tectimicrobiota bacterium TaxID=2528274 RepID=A0A932FZI2_UNCTE|nr:phosphoribosylamine--glycine ligase [Candidatus Tectomicrobia bacterium]